MKLPVKIPVRLPVAVVDKGIETMGVKVGRPENPADASADVTKLRNPIVREKKNEYGRSVMLTTRSLRMPLMMEGKRLTENPGGIWLISFAKMARISPTSATGIPLRSGAIADVAAEANEVGSIVGVVA